MRVSAELLAQVQNPPMPRYQVLSYKCSVPDIVSTYIVILDLLIAGNTRLAYDVEVNEIIPSIFKVASSSS